MSSQWNEGTRAVRPGIQPTPSYVGEPERNGAMGAVDPDTEGGVFVPHDFQTLEEARQVIGEFIEAYNREWLIERPGHRTPADVRQALTRKAA